MRSKTVAALISLALLVSLLAACATSGQSQPTKTPTAAQGQTPTVYAIGDSTGDWGYPSPYAHYRRGPGYTRMSHIFDTLVWKDATGIVPALAEKWEYKEVEGAYLFWIRDDALWHDGHKFSAADVVFTFDYMKKHPYAWVDLSLVAKVKVTDQNIVKITLEEPYAPFLTNIAGTMPILPQHIWEKITEPEKATGPDIVIGTGPFKLVDYSREHGTYLYEAFQDYYGGQLKVDQLKYVKVGTQVAAAALQKGDVQAVGIEPEQVEDIKKAGKVVIRSSYEWNGKLMINHKKEPFSNKAFRQALALLIDRDQLVQIVLRSHAMTGNPGLIPPDSEWYEPNAEQYKYDPQRAQVLLEGLGYSIKDGQWQKDGQALQVELLVRADPTQERVAEFIKAQLEASGIAVNLTSLESKTVDSRVAQWNFDLAVSGHGGLGGDPDILTKVILDESFNSARYQANQQLVGLLKAQGREMNSEQRKELVRQIQRIYADELPALTLYYPDSYMAHDGSIDLYYTPGGLGSGVPIPQNKLAFVSPKQ